MFWLDLASSHYANIVNDCLLFKKKNFVPKKDNPPNVPQARGIEQFWSICKSKYSSRPHEPKNLQGFKQIWAKISKEAAAEVGIEVMQHARRYITGIGYKGVRQAMCDISNKRRP